MEKSIHSAFRFWAHHARPRIRDLIILILAIGGVLGWTMHCANVQRGAVASIVRAGGAVVYHGMTSNEKPSMGWRVRWLRWMGKCLGVDYFLAVDRVNIGGGRGSDPELIQIGRLVDLRELCAAGSPGVTDLGLVHIRDLKNLRILSLHSTLVGNAGLAQIGGLIKLRRLYLGSTRVTDSGLLNLEGLTDLRILDLRNNEGITGSGLEHLKNMNRLSWLLLGGTKVGDADLVHLRNLNSLRFLDLKDTCVSATGVQWVRQALPRLAVSF